MKVITRENPGERKNSITFIGLDDTRKMTLKKGDVIEVFVEEQRFPKEGVARYEGKRMKIDQALLGQTLQVRVQKCNDRRMLVRNIAVVKPADYEIEPACSFSDFCGGCTFPTVPYEMQVKMKEKEVLDQLEKNGVFVEEFLGMEGCSRIFGYRNKMEYTFGDQEKGGEPALGMHRKGRFMDIVTVEDCVIAPPDFNKIVERALDLFRSRGIPHYHKNNKTGFQRNLIVRWGEKRGELLVNLVTTSERELDRDAFVKALLDLETEHEIVGITWTINDGIAYFVYCDELHVLWGRGYYMEELLGLQFKVSPFSFFQTNTEAAERLYAGAMEFIDALEGKTVFDLYCGTGTITQIMARKAKLVVGIEIVAEAVEAARENAALNGLDNCKFLAGDVFEMLDQVEEKPDLIVLDPPRAGILPKALRKILDYQVGQIVYISCNPLTMAQNLAVMQEEGYRVKKIKAYDNFPWTKHVECVVLMSRVKE